MRSIDQSVLEIVENIGVEIKSLKDKLPKTPCDLCAYNPPSSLDGKPCTCCPATPVQ